MVENSNPNSLGKAALNRRTLLKAGGAVGGATALLGALDLVAWKPLRKEAGAATISDIQHGIGAFIAPAFDEEGVRVQFGPIFTQFRDPKRCSHRSSEAKPRGGVRTHVEAGCCVVSARIRVSVSRTWPRA